MSTTILSVKLLIYCQIIYMIFYFHYFGYVGGVGCKVNHVTLIFFCIIYDKTKHSKLQIHKFFIRTYQKTSIVQY